MTCKHCAHSRHCHGQKHGCNSFVSAADVAIDNQERAKASRELDEYRDAFVDYAYDDGDYLQDND